MKHEKTAQTSIVRRYDLPAADALRPLPDQLCEMACLLTESGIGKVVQVSLITPSFDGGGDVGVAFGQILARVTALGHNLETVLEYSALCGCVKQSKHV